MKIGIIAEDDSDVAVVRALTLSLLRPQRAAFKKFVGHGSGKLRRKCGAWAENLVRQGCRWIAVVHDLDVHDETELRTELTRAICSIRSMRSVVLIPRREIESWLLYDARAIATSFNESRVLRLPGRPESLVDPKRALEDLVWTGYRKRYLNTVHNEPIAKRIDLARLRGAASFAPHPEFVKKMKRASR